MEIVSSFAFLPLLKELIAYFPTCLADLSKRILLKASARALLWPDLPSPGWLELPRADHSEKAVCAMGSILNRATQVARTGA